MKTAIITVGVPGSGKSTFARQIMDSDSTYTTISRDAIRRKMFNVEGWSEYDYNTENEQSVSTEEYNSIRMAANNGMNVIIADTNLRMKYVRSLIRLLGHHGYETKIKLFDISLAESLRRGIDRTNQVPGNVALRQIEQYNIIKDKILARYADLLLK